VGIKAVRILKQNEDTLETRDIDDNDDEEQSDAELYKTNPLELDTKTEFTRYLKLLVIPRETDMYNY
jgi:hypothetical protein